LIEVWTFEKEKEEERKKERPSKYKLSEQGVWYMKEEKIIVDGN